MKMNQLLLCALLALPLGACHQKSTAPTPAATKTTAPATTTAAATTGKVGDDPAVPKLAVGTAAKCAVTGEDFTVKESTVQVTYNGKRYAFCCPDCQPTFAKDPAKYAKN
ncbi:MAG TPA: YHS domain-containing protein [Polyangia bacterium]|nr:YHS domain-containing protein [Polyangia bacterium]